MTFPVHASPNRRERYPHGHVLIVEDEASILVMLKAAIQRAGRIVECVARGDQALDRITAGGIDVVLLDLGLPDTAGIEVLKRSRRDAPDTEVIVVTGTHDLAVAVQALRQGAYDYLTKPVNLSKVGGVVDRCVEARTTRRTTRLSTCVHKIASISELDDLPGCITTSAVAVAGASAASLFLVDQDGGLKVIETQGPTSGQALGRAKQVVVSRRWHRWWMPSESPPIVAWPMQVEGRIIGVLVVEREPGQPTFEPGAIERLGIVAAAGALAADRLIKVGALQKDVNRLSRSR